MKPKPIVIRVTGSVRMPSAHFGSERTAMGAIISKLKPGDSFVWPGYVSQLYTAAKDVGAKITIRKENGTGTRVWRKL